jgi:UDP-N-acetylglucosamine--N-acetylmuramyl-(pentapeptide) pyrophosphoryl-undecaprenol N-acetylglucosamine transferase
LDALEVKIEQSSRGTPTNAGRLDAGKGAASPAGEVRSLRVLMVAGGTGGHIFPALAVAEELRERAKHRDPNGPGCDILFLGTGRGLETRVIPAAGFPLRTIAAAGLKGIGGWQRLRNLLVLPRSAIETALIIGKFQPDVVVGIGGYLAGPAMLEAALKDIPTLLIEPNAVPGFTNRVLAPVVRLAAVAFVETASFYRAKGRLTGHAVRKEFSSVPAKEHVPPYTVLILGGSQGSAAINDCVVRSLPRLANDAPRLTFIHQTGDRDYNAVRQAYQERGLTAEVQAFIENVPQAFARADLVVSRAGANAVAELAAAGKAALLIPFPGATDQHQLENAKAMERAGAARILRQVELTPDRLVRELWDLLAHPDRLTEMEQAARRLARPDAAQQIADLVEQLAKK